MICKRCNSRYDATNLPKNLPCGDVICTNCENLLRENSKIAKCVTCSAEHSLTDDIQLSKCKVLIEMLSLKPNEIHRSDEVEKLKQFINDVKSNVVSIEKMLNGSVDMIKEHCAELRNEVQLATELKIQKLNELNIELIDDIYKYENECCAKFLSDASFQKTNISQQLVQSKEFTTEWTSYLNEFKIDDQIVKQTNEEGSTLLKTLKESLISLKHWIFNGYILSFKQNSQELNHSIIGSLCGDIEMDSAILDNTQIKKLMSLFPTDKTSNKWNLLYKGTRDGLNSSHFHCSGLNHSQLLVVVKTDQNELLGGYTDLNWFIDNQYVYNHNYDSYERNQRTIEEFWRSDPNAFIFKFNNSANDFIKYSYSYNYRNSIKCSPSYCPFFGSNDMYIYNNIIYYDSSKFGETRQSNKNHIIVEMEVFCLVNNQLPL